MTMFKRRFIYLALPLVVGAGLMPMGCRDLPGVSDPNAAPIANAGRDQEFTDETQVTVTLDGSDSSDPDGRIRSYRWLSADVTEQDAGGIERIGPEVDAVAKPKVKLSEGVWTFTLWVEDDRGLYSAPDSVVITVGAPTDTRIDDCVADAADSVDEACRRCVCAIDDVCRDVAVTCDDNCWGLTFCGEEMCGDVSEADLPGCVIGGCSEFLGGSEGAQALAPCWEACVEECL